MSTANTSIVPISLDKRIYYEMHGDQAVYELNPRTISDEERERLSSLVDFVFVFGLHGTEPAHYTEVEKTFDNISDDSIVCFESAGFSLVDEAKKREFARTASYSQRMRMQREAVLRSRNSVGNNYLLSLNAFFYAEQSSFANGYDVHYADMDAWHHNRFMQMAKASHFEENEVHDNEMYAMHTQDWKLLPIVEATLDLRKRLAKSTVIIELGKDANGHYREPLVVPHWGTLHREREEAVVDRVISLALKKLEATDHTPDKKLPVYTFFGAGHARGIRKRFNDRQLFMRSIMMSNEPLLPSTDDVEVTSEDIRAFAREWAGMQLRQLYGQQPRDEAQQNLFNNQIEATKRAIDLMPLDDIINFYEAYRSAVRYFETPRDDAQLTPLARELSARRSRNHENKEHVFENLLLQAMRKQNMSLQDATNRYIAEREKAFAELFGRVQQY